jgi:hypothetical protein
MAAQQFANNAQTTLASICNPGDSSISVVSAVGFPTSVPYTVLIDAEYLLVTSGASTTTWGVSRAQEGSSAGTHAAAATVTQDFTVAGLQSLDQAYYPFWGVSGLTGAIQPSRYVGAVGTGTPGSGTFVVGDFVVVQTGGIAVCTVGGTPGTWVSSLPRTATGLYAGVITTGGPAITATSSPGTQITGATATFTVGAGRQVLIRWNGSSTMTTTNDTVVLLTKGGVAMTNANVTATGSPNVSHTVETVDNPAAGSVTYAASAYVGGGTLTPLNGLFTIMDVTLS